MCMLFSIVTICYNSEKTIERTLRSVAMQKFTDYEHIIIDGASTDQTLAIIKAQNNVRCRIISEADNGIYNAMNKGLTHAKGDYIIYLNSDDFLASDQSLHYLASCADDSDIILGHTQFNSEKKRWFPRRKYRGTSAFERLISYGIMPPHPSTAVRTALMREIGGFDEQYRVSADFDLFARLFLTKNVTCSAVDQCITYFTEGGLSTRQTIVPEIGKDIIKSLNKYNIPMLDMRIRLRFLYKLSQYFHIPKLMDENWIKAVS